MKQRLDDLLVGRGWAKDRAEAGRMIMAGEVMSDQGILDKPGLNLSPDLELRLKAKPAYVSRGGDKLASVVEALKLAFQDKVVADIGSSTGGFTDYALKAGAAKIYCIDVGKGQLDYGLRNDRRVVVMEQTDVRGASLPERADLALVDVSFISLIQVLESVVDLLKPGGSIVALVKPQFEASRQVADRHKGVIPDRHRPEIFRRFEDQIKSDFEVIKWADSGIAGAKGNLERFYLLKPKH